MGKSESNNLNYAQDVDLSEEVTGRFVEVVNSLPRKKDAARIAGCSQHQLLRYRRGTRIPFDVIGCLCDESGHSIDWVWSGKGPKYRNQAASPASNEIDFNLITKCMDLLEEIISRDDHFQPNRTEKAIMVGMLYRTYIENIREDCTQTSENNTALFLSSLHAMQSMQHDNVTGTTTDGKKKQPEK